jgi:predicted phage tail component-like protein
MSVGYVLTWDGNPSSALEELVVVSRMRRGMVGRVRDTLMPVPGRDGDYLFTERRGNRRISAEGQVIAPSDVRHAAVVALADWLDKSGYRRLIVSDQPDRYWQATLATDPDPDEWQSQGKFTLEWSAEPYAYAITTSEVCATGSNGSVQMFVPDDAVDAYPIIEVTVSGGGATAMPEGFTFTMNGDSLTYSGAVVAGQTITINSLTYTVLEGLNTDEQLLGAYDTGTVFPGDVSGTFPYIREGTNEWSVVWTGGATMVTVCIYWRRRYR